MSVEDGLTPDAVKVLRMILLSMPLRQKMKSRTDEEYIWACYTLMEAGFAQIYDTGDGFRFDITPQGMAMLGLSPSAH